MGSERASTTRRRRAGKICCHCESILPEPDSPGERYCARCEKERGRRRVYMSFLLRELWDCQFLEEDLKTSLPRRVSFSDPVEMREFAERGGCILDLEGRQAFDHALAIGRGGVWLSVTAGQYASLSERVGL